MKFEDVVQSLLIKRVQLRRLFFDPRRTIHQSIKSRCLIKKSNRIAPVYLGWMDG